jgi:hypothetical protein
VVYLERRGFDLLIKDLRLNWRPAKAGFLLPIDTAAEAGHYSHWEGRKHTEESKQKMSKQVICITDNIIFPSLTKTLEHYQIVMPTLRRALLSEASIKRGKLTGYVFKYLD